MDASQENQSGWTKPQPKETLPQVLDKIAQLHAELRRYEQIAAEMKEAERLEAIAAARNLMRAHGLTLHDLGAGHDARKSPKAGTKAPVKFRDPETGNTWTGRGLQPVWLRTKLASGKTLTDFQV